MPQPEIQDLSNFYKDTGIAPPRFHALDVEIKALIQYCKDLLQYRGILPNDPRSFEANSLRHTARMWCNVYQLEPENPKDGETEWGHGRLLDRPMRNFVEFETALCNMLLNIGDQMQEQYRREGRITAKSISSNNIHLDISYHKGKLAFYIFVGRHALIGNLR